VLTGVESCIGGMKGWGDHSSRKQH
jgi:hypothetical protein